MWVDFPIFGDYNKRTDINFDTEDLANLFLIQDPNGKKKFAFLATPGLKKELTLFTGTSESRALYAFGNQLFGVFGNQVYMISEFLIPLQIGAINTDTGFVSIEANNAGQIIIVDGLNGYIYDTNSGVFSQITDPGFPAFPLNVGFLDGYFVIPSGNTRTYQISALNDGTKWDALDEAQIQAYPGLLVGVGVVNRRLYFFKTDSTEVWYNQGAADFPFRRDNNLLFNFGCLTASSIASQFGYLFWLAQDKDGVGSVMMTTGQDPQRISDDSIDNLIGTFNDPADVRTYIYKDNGHIFYVMNFTTDDITLVYDVTMKAWHKMSMEQFFPNASISYATPARHIANCHAYFNGKHYVAAYNSPTVYSFSRLYADNDGQPISRLRTAKHYFDEEYRMLQIEQLQIDMEMGIGMSGVHGQQVSDWIANDGSFIVTNTGDNIVFNPGIDIDDDPQVYLFISRDGGHVFGNAHKASIGMIGERKARAIFRRLGLARDFVAKFVVMNPVYPITILGAAIKLQVLNK